MTEIQKFNHWLSENHASFTIPEMIINQYSESVDPIPAVLEQQWIPIKSEEDVAGIFEDGYVTLERKDKKRFVTQIHSINRIFDYIKFIGVKPLAYMLTKYPKPYDK